MVPFARKQQKNTARLATMSEATIAVDKLNKVDPEADLSLDNEVSGKDINTEGNIGAHAFEPELDINQEEREFNIQEDEHNEDSGSGYLFEEDRFTVSKPVWNDAKFGIFFLVVFLTFIITSMVLFIKYFDQFVNEAPPIDTEIPNSVYFEVKTIFMIFFTVTISFAISILIFIFASKSPNKFINIGFKSIFVLALLTAIMSLVTVNLINFFIAGFFTVLIGLVNYKYKPLLSLASNILQIVISVLKKYPQTCVAALFGFFGKIIFTIILGISIGCTYIAYGFHSNGTPKYEGDKIISEISTGLIISIILINFAGLYIIDVIENVMHVTIGGIYGTWYYMESSFSGMPKNEGVGSFKRAMTYSFGSICYGSLYVVLFQSIAIIFLVGGNSLNLFGVFFNAFFKFSGLCVGYFNLYAFSFVALYGVSMVKSIKSTYKFFKQRGYQALCNDFIISSSLGFYCFIAGLLSMIIIGLYLFLMQNLIKLNEGLILPLLTFTFLLTINITNILIITIISGSSVFFFALNKDPSVFQESNPFEFQEISRCYPRVLDKLNL